MTAARAARDQEERVSAAIDMHISESIRPARAALHNHLLTYPLKVEYSGIAA